MRAEILSASAGSGKTFRLAYKYIRDVIENPSSYRNILAVTFTNKATEEMKSRIIRQLHLLAEGDSRSDYALMLSRELDMPPQKVREQAQKAQSLILHDYSRFTILTIDKFFQRILRAFIRELGLDLDYSVELDTAPLLEKSAEALIKQAGGDRELQKWLTDFSHEQLDNNRGWNIRNSLTKIGSEIFKEQNRDAISRAKPKEELERIIKDAAKRAEESQKQISELARKALGIMADAGVEHSDFNRSFTTFFVKLAEDGTAKPSDTVLKRAESSDGWFTKKGGTPSAESISETLRGLLAEAMEIRSRNLRLWTTVRFLRDRFRAFALLSDLYEAAAAICEEENTMLLSEAKYLLSKFVSDSDAPFIYEKIGSRFDRYMIDEFQDTSLKEWKNFLPLLQNAMAQSEETSVLLVGDVKQSIYRWRGGDRSILGETAARDLKPENVGIGHLRDNYRSLPVVVQFNNDIISRAVEADNLALNDMLDEASRSGRISPATADELHDSLAKAYADVRQVPGKRRCEHDGFVDISIYGDEEPPIIGRIKEVLDKGFKPKDIMILVRDGKDGVKIANTLLAFKDENRDPRYAFDVMTQEALIIGSAPVVRFTIAAMALAVNPEAVVERAVFRRFGGAATPEVPLTEEETAFLRSIRMLSPEEAFERIVIRFGLDRKPEYTAYLQALHERIVRFCSGRVADISMWLDHWNETDRKKSLSVEQSETTIEIITIHKAKGLEKRVVIIPYCNWKLKPLHAVDNYVWSEPKCSDDPIKEIGIFPVTYRNDMADSFFAEDFYRELTDSHVDNVNLLYVALTRAAESLHIFIPEKDSVSADSVGSLVVKGAELTGKEFAEGEGGCRHARFGEFAGPCTDRRGVADKELCIIDSYRTRKADLQLALPAQRYFEERESDELTPRNFGILMHQAFAAAESADDIATAVAKMRDDALLSEAEAEHLKRMTEKVLENPLVRGWFDNDEGRAEVRNENAIILPAGRKTMTRRPDRVIIRGGRATVVDYKFGHEKKSGYARQTAEYVSLLREMGYKDVEGYIWYVLTGEIERVQA